MCVRYLWDAKAFAFFPTYLQPSSGQLMVPSGLLSGTAWYGDRMGLMVFSLSSMFVGRLPIRLLGALPSASTLGLSWTICIPSHFGWGLTLSGVSGAANGLVKCLICVFNLKFSLVVSVMNSFIAVIVAWMLVILSSDSFTQESSVCFNFKFSAFKSVSTFSV
eukprot:15012.XXX_466270_466758_1 [CDS] Oithona nana genome sequencing.